MTVAADEELRVQTALATGAIRAGLRGYPVRACADIGEDVPLTCSTEITQVAGQSDLRTGLLKADGWLIVVGGVRVGAARCLCAAPPPTPATPSPMING